MQIADFLAKFDNAKKTGDQWLVKCPSHKDRKASLAVKEGNDNRLLLCCHAGCDISAILSSLGLTDRDLFESAPALKATIAKTYDYIGLDGQVQYQVVRLEPKDFRQRRPDGSGGWIWNLQGVDRILYRLPELQGKPSVVNCEGEKDADALHALGIPATTNCGGAGKWSEAYTASLKAAGVQRVAILPDNDPPGLTHASIVAKSLLQIGIEPRVVVLPGLPAKGDVSDYLASGKGKDDLLGLIRTTAVWADAPPSLPPDNGMDEPPLSDDGPHETIPLILDRAFHVLGDDKFSLELQPAGIVFDVDRLRRERNELHGELSVRVNGSFPRAKTFKDGFMTVGDLNFSSMRAVQDRASLLSKRSGDSRLDWHGLLEEFIVSVVQAERAGPPAVILADIPEPDEEEVVWRVGDFPLPRDLPSVLYGDSDSGKSYFAMWFAGSLASQGEKVIYADWEFTVKNHRRRFGRLFQPMSKNLIYVSCTQSMKHHAEALEKLVKQHRCTYIICDSIGFATEGPAEGQESAATYFRYLRQLGIGSLNLAHTPKQTEDGKDPQIFGSTFYRAGARSVWFIKRSTENPRGELRIGLYHKKYNEGDRLQPRGFSLKFESQRTLVSSIKLDTVDELAASLPVMDRMKRVLSRGAMTIKALAEELDISSPTIRKTVGRHESQFIRVGQKVGLREHAEEF